MKVKYIYDSKGKKTAIIVPIEIWEKNKSTLKKINQIKSRLFNPSDYRGIYREMKLDLEKESRNLRDEWVRI